ncbi:MAG: hypothetical protein ABSD53_17045 [Terriglobales bacterium]|jgi:hypothetical protein
MFAVLTERTEEIKRFRATPWLFQQTFLTPLKDLNRFVSTFLEQFSLEKGALSTDQVVFEPQNLLGLLANQSLSVDNYYDLKIEALGKPEIANLLSAALGDWVDFVFVPSPEVIAIYTDHDEYTTFYARDEATLKTLSSRLETAGFKAVANYIRGSSGDRWR